MNVLVIGGAGYIGSHVLRVMARHGHACVVVDDLSKGHAQAVGGAHLIRTGAADQAALVAAMRQHKTELVIHLAAFIEAGESVMHPDKYFRNNTLIGLTLLEAMRQAGVGRLVFSSTAAVYGQPQRVPIRESDRLEPINPYGSSKLCVEYMMQAYARAYGLGCITLRYFNVAGADGDGTIGEDHHPETHLVPLVLQAALGRRSSVKIYGEDYQTPDGTCIRDFIHVMDLAEAHRLAAEAIEPGTAKAYNLGNGEGFSVRQIIDTCRQVTGRPIPTEPAPRRPGDPARLIASADLAHAELGWTPRFPAIATIIEHAWRWHQGHPDGYGA